MIVSLTGQYAIRAMIHLARNSERWPLPGKEIAEHAGIPRKYLSKILADLVRAGVLNATRGRSGGFRMVRLPKHVSLGEVLAPFEPIVGVRRHCPFGSRVCSEDKPCGGHHRWRIVCEAYDRFLKDTSIHDMTIAKPKSSRKCAKKRTRRRVQQ